VGRDNERARGTRRMDRERTVQSGRVGMAEDSTLSVDSSGPGSHETRYQADKEPHVHGVVWISSVGALRDNRATWQGGEGGEVISRHWEQPISSQAPGAFSKRQVAQVREKWSRPGICC
jgi:hypothetical protein